MEGFEKLNEMIALLQEVQDSKMGLPGFRHSGPITSKDVLELVKYTF